jgi:hypothetical protein
VAGNSAPQFRFDKVAHAYYVGDLRLPSITQILRATLPAGASSVQWYTEESAARGTRIHEATARFDLGGGWGEDLLESDLPRVRAYAAFLAARQPVYTEVEQPRYSSRHGFAGTTDRRGRWQDGREFVLDLKTGGVIPDCGLQTAAQALLWTPDWRGLLRYTLHLRDDGQYRLRAWTDPADWSRFLVRLHTFQMENA